METRCSLVIPAYNEDEVLRQALKKIIECVKIEFECIVVVDDKSDLSIPIVLEIQKIDSRFTFFVNDHFPAQQAQYEPESENQQVG